MSPSGRKPKFGRGFANSKNVCYTLRMFGYPMLIKSFDRNCSLDS